MQRVSNTTRLVEVPDSESGPRKGVWVQVPPSVLDGGPASGSMFGLESKTAVAPMLRNPVSSDRPTAHPVILGAGLTGLAISRALSAAGITHMLVGDRPAETPRLGESLNAEG